MALHLMCTDVFIKMFEDQSYVAEILDFTNRVAMAMAGYYLEAGCDIIAVVDPMTSQIGWWLISSPWIQNPALPASRW